jgi:serine/threonine protein kinase
LKGLEIARENITINRELGSGQFGQVFECAAIGLPNTNGKTTTVAVKFLSDTSSQSDSAVFIEEALRMRNLNHKHVVRLLAVCFSVSPGCIVLEYMAKGDLKDVLRNMKAVDIPALTQFVHFKSYRFPFSLDTLHFLRKYSERFGSVRCIHCFDLSDSRCRMCCDVSEGLAYLASLKYVHRDIAARNVLVDAHNVLKIADFGA